MAHLRYAVRIAAPAQHLAEIELRFPVDAETVDVTLPAWCPGSYLIRDYARFVRDLAASGDDGAARRPGDEIDLAVFRRARLLHLKLRLAAAPATRYELVGVPDSGPAARYQAWLGEPHPGAQVVATITTTARWV